MLQLKTWELETMARKLSPIARRVTNLLVAGAVSFAASASLAQSDSQATQSAAVINNPFIATQAPAQPKAQAKLQSSSTSQTVSEPRQKAPRRAISYQNPFNAASKAPPVDTSLRPGPISRWRHPVIPGESASPIKSAMLSAPAGEPARRTWAAPYPRTAA